MGQYVIGKKAAPRGTFSEIEISDMLATFAKNQRPRT